MNFKVSLLSLLIVVSCASKKEVRSTDADTSGTIKEELVLNGSSDDLKAGGLRTVHFDFLSSSFNGKAKEVMEKNKQYLEKNPNISVQIEGHCDERGSAQYNLALGERRAKVVRDYLRGRGIKVNRMSIISYGKEKPIAEGNDDQMRSKNRRASFVISSK